MLRRICFLTLCLSEVASFAPPGCMPGFPLRQGGAVCHQKSLGTPPLRVMGGNAMRRLGRLRMAETTKTAEVSEEAKAEKLKAAMKLAEQARTALLEAEKAEAQVRLAEPLGGGKAYSRASTNPSLPTLRPYSAWCMARKPGRSTVVHPCPCLPEPRACFPPVCLLQGQGCARLEEGGAQCQGLAGPNGRVDLQVVDLCLRRPGEWDHRPRDRRR